MRFATAIGVLLLCAGTAEAAPKRKVKIDSDPEGATVYLNVKEDGPVCTTPCEISVPVGETPIIVELENHKQLFENLVVSGRKTVTVKYKLVPAIGTINVKGPAGAKITVDDVDKGKAPAKFDAPAGAHTVILTLDGKKVATEFVEVEANDEAVVEGKAAKATTTAETKKEEVEEEEEKTTTSTSVSTSASVEKPRTRGPYLSLAAAMEIGFRNFTYDNAQTPNLTPEKEGGQVLVGPVAEVWPGTLAGIHALRGLAVYLRFGYGVNPQAVKQKTTNMTTSAKTFWRSFEASIRHRWTIASTATVEVGGGFVRDQYQFSGGSDDIKLVPDADYQSVKIGARASLLLGSVEPYLVFENRNVLSGGTLEKRFSTASATGLRVAGGMETKLGAVNVRVEGALNRYSWTFKNTDPMPDFNADGGTDSIKLITAAIGYAY